MIEPIKLTVRSYLKALRKRKKVDDSYQPPSSIALVNATYTLLIQALLNGIVDARRKVKINLAEDEPQSDDYSLILGIEMTGREESYQSVTHKEALKVLKGKLPVTAKEWQKLSDNAQSKAFFVTQMTQLSAVNKVQAYLTEALENKEFERGGLRGFLQSVDEDELIKKAGWSKNNPWYYETVYRTNAQQAYNHGRVVQWEGDKPEALEYVSIGDSRRSKICSERDGIIKAYGDPWWKTNTPPLHFNCRSTLLAHYEDVKTSEASPQSPTNGFGKWPELDDTIPADLFVRATEKGIVDYRAIAANFPQIINEKTSVKLTLDKERMRKTKLSGNEDIWLAPGAKTERIYDHELLIAKILAERGEQVFFLAASTVDGEKTADTYLPKMQALCEFKTTESVNPNTIKKTLRAAAKQGDVVVINFSKKINKETVINAVENAKRDGLQLKRLFIIIEGKVEQIESES